MGGAETALLTLDRARAAGSIATEATVACCGPCKGKGKARVGCGNRGGAWLEGTTRGCSLVAAVAAWLVVSEGEASSGPADESEGEGEAEAARAVVLLLCGVAKGPTTLKSRHQAQRSPRCRFFTGLAPPPSRPTLWSCALVVWSDVINVPSICWKAF